MLVISKVRGYKITVMKIDKTDFILVVECSNPVEAEIFPAVMREKEIPHRTEWASDGTLKIFVLAEFEDEARSVLQQSREIFFAGLKSQPSKVPDSSEEDEEIEQWRYLRPRQPIENLQKKPVWPAWLLAFIPGLGLGHLYAGKFQIFIFLVFASALGIAYYAYSHSLTALLLPMISWATDLGFAAFHVKEHNRRVERLEMKALAAEKNDNEDGN